jgi:D-cysteine desulfhydrase
MELLRRRQGTDLLIFPGAMGATGTLGYFDAARELIDQTLRGDLPVPDLIVTATGSGSTAAGLLAGLELSGLETRVLAVPVAPLRGVRALVVGQASAALQRLGQRLNPLGLSRRLLVSERQIGPGYGRPLEEHRRAADDARQFGLALDLTYTAKSFTEALQQAETVPGSESGKQGHRPRKILYWHTLSSRPMDSLLALAPAWEDLPRAVRALFLEREKGL